MIKHQDLYITIIDKLRYERHFTVETFTEGICDRTQYYKYLKSRNIPIDVLGLFCEKLKLSLPEFIELAHRSSDQEFMYVRALLEAVQTNQISEIQLLLKRHNKDKFITLDSQRAYEYALIRLDVLSKTRSINPYSRYKQIAVFPDKITLNALSYLELCILYEMAIIELRENLTPYALNILTQWMIAKPHLKQFQGDQSSIVIPIYSLLVRMCVINRNPKLGIELYQEGLNFVERRQSHYGLAHFYYYGWAIYAIDKQIDSAVLQMKKCYLILHLNNIPEQSNYYTNQFKKDAEELKFSKTVFQKISGFENGNFTD